MELRSSISPHLRCRVLKLMLSSGSGA
jgi:hypothetical protein